MMLSPLMAGWLLERPVILRVSYSLFFLIDFYCLFSFKVMKEKSRQKGLYEIHTLPQIIVHNSHSLL